MIEIRWHGRGGQGAFTASKILGGAAILNDEYALAFPSFGPERRGAPIQAFTKIDSSPIRDRSAVKQCDYIIYLDETLFVENALGDLKNGGKVLVNTACPEKYKKYTDVIGVDGSSIAQDVLHMSVTNTAMLAALVAVSEIVTVEQVKVTLSDYLSDKIVKSNIELIERVYTAVKVDK